MYCIHAPLTSVAHAVPSTVGKGDGSNEFVCSKGCRCAVLMTILFGGIVLGVIALQTPKTKPPVPAEPCPPGAYPATVYQIGRPVKKDVADASPQKPPFIILASGEPCSPTRELSPIQEKGPSGDDQVPTSETTEPCPRSSDSVCDKTSEDIVCPHDQSTCECCQPRPLREEPPRCVDDATKPRKKKTRKRRKPQATSAGPPSETGSRSSRSRSRRASRRRSRTSSADRPTENRPPTHTSSRSRPRAKRKARK